MLNPKGIVFDCDGVLFESKSANLAYYNEVLGAFDVAPVTIEQHERAHICHTAATPQVFAALLGPERAALALAMVAKLDYKKFIPFMTPEPQMQEVIATLAARYPLAVAAQSVLIPMQCEYYALEGLSDLVGTVKRVRANLNPQLEITGLVRTMYDARNTLAQQVSTQLETHFGDKVYRSLVPRNVRLAEAPSYGIPAVVWDPESKGAQAYLALAEEMLERERAGVPAAEA
jgi:hypothetical protein